MVSTDARRESAQARQGQSGGPILPEGRNDRVVEGDLSLRAFLTGLSLCLALSGAALAQQAPPQFSKLHDDLRLTADQDPDWRQYLAAVSGNGQIQAQRQSAEMLLPQLQTPRRLALMDATMTQELADFRRQGQATAAFYNKLTPDQQRTFDRETLPNQGGG
jgi:hypothetical protein